jgi:hypothetical protein
MSEKKEHIPFAKMAPADRDPGTKPLHRTVRRGFTPEQPDRNLVSTIAKFTGGGQPSIAPEKMPSETNTPTSKSENTEEEISFGDFETADLTKPADFKPAGTPSIFAPQEPKVTGDSKPILSPAPDEQTIPIQVNKFLEQQPEKSETAGFKADGERVRVILPDDPANPERVARVTQLGLSALRAINEIRKRAKKNK